MAHCDRCLFYSKADDELMRSHDDVIIVGQEQKDRHYCFAFEPIPDGVFNGEKDCPNYTPSKEAT